MIADKNRYQMKGRVIGEKNRKDYKTPRPDQTKDNGKNAMTRDTTTLKGDGRSTSWYVGSRREAGEGGEEWRLIIIIIAIIISVDLR